MELALPVRFVAPFGYRVLAFTTPGSSVGRANEREVACQNDIRS